MDPGPLRELPEWYWQVPYTGAGTPGATGNVADGANCQRWAYEVLAHFGFSIPPLRSDELCADRAATRPVDTPEPLDLMLFNHTSDPHGAHVGIWTGGGVAHLCAEVGGPVVWDLVEFDARERYATLVAVKRPIRRGVDVRPDARPE